MLSFFRNFFKSKFGVTFTLAFLGLIAFAFAAADVSTSGTFGGVAGGDRVAVVGSQKIGAADLTRATNNAVESMRQDNPTLSTAAFIQQGGLTQVLDSMIDRFAIAEYAKKYGLRAGDNLVNSEIMAISAFHNASGNFDEAMYRQAIGSRGLTDEQVRQDFSSGLLAKEMLVPASFGAKAPDKIVSQYAALLKERRLGSVGIIPSAAFLPPTGPTDKQLNDFYMAHRGDYIRPERRVLRFAEFGEDALGATPDPTEKEIAARYERDKEKYAPSETRVFSQLIVPTEQAAKTIVARVVAGGSLEAAARAAGLEVAKIGPLTKEKLSSQASSDVANASFAAADKAIAAPARSGLGWHVMRVDQVEKIAGKTLEKAKPEIVAQLREEKRRLALSDLSASIEDKLDGGESLSDLAKSMNLEVKTTDPMLANGQVYGRSTETAPKVLTSVLQTAFQMEEGQPQLAEVERGKSFLIYEASKITPSASAPLAEIKADVAKAWRLAEGAKAAKVVADRILASLAKGDTTLQQALSAEKKPFPPAESINLTREQITAQKGRVPPPLALLFSMAQGSSKKLEAPQNTGWFIVNLAKIETGNIPKDDPVFQQAKNELGQTIGREYSDDLRSAIRDEIGAERNAAAIEAVRKQLAGAN